MSTLRTIKLKPQKTKRGFGLILVIGFAAILAIFTAVIGSRASYNLATVSRAGQADQAYYGAQTAIQLAVSFLCEPPAGVDLDNDGTYGDSWLAHDRRVGVNLPNGVSAASRLYHNIPGLPGGVSEPLDLNGDHQPDNVPPDGTKIPPGLFYVMAVGETKSKVQSESVTMGALLSPEFPVLTNAAYALDSLKIKGRVDYFDSSSAKTSPTSTWPTFPAVGLDLSDPSVGLPSAHVALAHIDITSPPQVIDASAEVNGCLLLDRSLSDAQVSTYASSVSPSLPADPANPGNAHLAAYVTKIKNETNLPQIEIPSLSPNVLELSSGDYTVPSTGLSLAEGKTYLCRGNLIVGSGSLTIDDTNGNNKLEAVRILVEGSQISFSGATGVNANNPPRLLKIFAANPCTLTLSSSSNVFALIAGYKLSATIDDTSQLWGALLGSHITIENGGTLHFDWQQGSLEKGIGYAGVSIGTSVVTKGAVTSVANLSTPNVPSAGPFPQYQPPTSPPGTPPGTPSGAPQSPPPLDDPIPLPPPPTGGGGGGGGGGSMMMESSTMEFALN